MLQDCCFHVMNHNKILLIFCLSGKKKKKSQKEKVWFRVKAALDIMKQGILFIMIKILNILA